MESEGNGGERRSPWRDRGEVADHGVTIAVPCDQGDLRAFPC